MTHRFTDGKPAKRDQDKAELAAIKADVEKLKKPK